MFSETDALMEARWEREMKFKRDNMLPGDETPMPFDRLFSSFSPKHTGPETGATWTFQDWLSNAKRMPTVSTKIGPGLSVSGNGANFNYGRAEPTPELVEWVKAKMTPVKRSDVYFELVRQSDGSVLVVAQHNLISGSQWVGYVDPATLPEGFLSLEDDE